MDALGDAIQYQYPELRTEISEAESDPDWDAFLSRTPGASHLQTSLWAQIKGPMGWRCARLIVWKDGSVVAGAQMLLKKTRLGTIGYVAKGPVVFPNDPHGLISMINDKVVEFARKRRVRLLLIQPPNDGHFIAKTLVSFGFKRSEISLAPVSSAFINLDCDSNTILAGMKIRTRYNLHLGERQGILVREGCDKDLKEFHDLYCKTVKRHGGVPEPYSYFHHMWRIFSPGGYIKLFLAELNGQTLAGNLLIVFSDTVIFKRTGWSGTRKLRPNELLHWSAITWAKSRGYSVYEFEGIDRRAAEAVLAGQSIPESLIYSPTAFKLGFGGKVVVYPDTYVYILNPILRWIYSRLLSRLAIRGQLWKMATALRGD